MDFIERLLTISPDAGSGATELMLLMVPASVLMLFTLGLHKLRKATGQIRSADSQKTE
jgi:hypothetical protein